MAGPFPGVDPYLESRYLWKTFHGSLIGEITAALNASLPEGLAANPEARLYISPVESTIITDIHAPVVDREATAPQPRAAVLDREVDHGVIAAYPEEERELFITIRSVQDWDEVVTVIEVLSPSNKREGSAGRVAYTSRQADLLDSGTNLVEIDLLRGGAHTVAAPKDRLALQGEWDGLVVVHRPAHRWHFEYWFCKLENPLPQIKVPLTDQLDDFELALQPLYDCAYDKGPYRRRINYRENPPVDLDDTALAWIDRWLTEKGVRPQAPGSDKRSG